MHRYLNTVLLVVALACPTALLAQGAPPASLVASLDAQAAPILQRVFNRVQAKVTSPEAYAEDLAALDALVVNFRTARREEAAKLAVLISDIHSRVLDDDKEAKARLLKVKSDFAGTQAAAEAEGKLAVHEKQERAEATRAGLVGKPAPELHFKWSTDGELKTLSSLKGKVVVLDFWATWCGPCIRSFPHLRQLAADYRDKDVVFVGVTSLQGMVANLKQGKVDTAGNPAKELELLKVFIEEKEMTWTVALSEENVFNEDYGITGIPHVAVIGRDGVVRKLTHPAELSSSDIDALLN
ncbi:MAG: TlpA disulfide reductase family protein [Opitutaceae bacterium]|nr:TlpA disulfide reductase family protein [Opitutaceae bacterium]